MFDKYSIQEITRQVKKNEKSIDEISETLPCHIHINSTGDFSLLETDKKILNLFDLTKADINEQGISLLEKTVNKIDLNNAIQVNLNYLKNQEEMSHVSFLQRVSFKVKSKEQLYYTRGKILDEKRILNLSMPMQDLKLFNHESLKLYHNSAFIKSNIHKYNLLTKREIQICKFLCDGSSLNEIAISLSISQHTIKNHKINIYKKLEVTNFFNFYNFCSKFKLN